MSESDFCERHTSTRPCRLCEEEKQEKEERMMYFVSQLTQPLSLDELRALDVKVRRYQKRYAAWARTQEIDPNTPGVRLDPWIVLRVIHMAKEVAK